MQLLELLWIEGCKAASALGTSCVNVSTVFEKQSLVQNSVLLTSETVLLLFCDHSQYLMFESECLSLKPMSFSLPYGQGFWPSFSDTASERYQILKKTSGWMGQEVGADREVWNESIAWSRGAATGKVVSSSGTEWICHMDGPCWHPELLKW